MDFELAAEQRLFRDTPRDFVDKEIRPVAQEWEATDRYPAEIVEKMPGDPAEARRHGDEGPGVPAARAGRGAPVAVPVRRGCVPLSARSGGIDAWP
ncbi:MAG: hypothetical protein GEV09_28330 [Pseudonocardiaceae bacterium]|nr:hypothetical protein [Actinophytocola sp.]MQA17820.1 hypothetical protein [Pseudonocardiaceae bacterium]